MFQVFQAMFSRVESCQSPGQASDPKPKGKHPAVVHRSVLPWTTSISAGIAGLLLVTVILLAPDPCRGQQKMTLTQEQWDTGLHGFAQVLRKLGVEFIRDYRQWNQYETKRTMLVLMGGIAAEDEAYIGKYLQQGGCVLLATDSDFGPVRIAGHNVEIAFGGRVRAKSASDGYLQNAEWPLVTKLDREHPLFSGVRAIACNLPAWLKLTPRVNPADGWNAIARYPALNAGSSGPFIVEYQNSVGGRLLIVPDLSVYVNGSLLVADNLRFLLNTAEWLRAGDRTKCLLMLNRQSALPLNVSNVDLYQAPPDAAETRERLDRLWNSTSTRDKLELANEALEFAQEEQLIEDLVESVKVDDLISPNRYLAILLFLAAWSIIIPFVVFLVSNRKKPLQNTSIDGLKPKPTKGQKSRDVQERFRAAEALYVHFFARLGMEIFKPKDVDPDRIQVLGDPLQTSQVQNDMRKIRDDLIRHPAEYWEYSKVEELGRYIAQWANLYETGFLGVSQSSEAADP